MAFDTILLLEKTTVGLSKPSCRQGLGLSFSFGSISGDSCRPIKECSKKCYYHEHFLKKNIYNYDRLQGFVLVENIFL